MPVLVTGLLALVVLAGCSSSSETTEVAGDADPNADGPLPTAPPDGAGGSGGSGATSVDVNELIRRIDALNSETDLCVLLTGQALADVTGADINLTSLVSNPSGFTQLFTSLDKLFAHMVTIGPPEVQLSLQVMQGVWKGMAGVDPRQPDAETRSATLIADPQVQQAQTDLGTWVRTSCTQPRPTTTVG